MAGNTDLQKEHFFQYCHSLFVCGKKVLLKLLGWFYKGGEKNYLDYLVQEYSLFGLTEITDVSRRYDLKYKTLMEFDMRLIYVLLKLACNLYNEKTQSNRGDFAYMLIEHGIESLMLQCANLSIMEPSLDSDELQARLKVLKELYGHLLTEGGRLSGRKVDEIQALREEACNLGTEEKGIVLYSDEEMAYFQQEADRMIPSEGKPTTDQVTAFCKDIMDQRVFSQAIKVNKNAVDPDEIQEFYQELSDYKDSLENKPCR